MEKNVCHLKDEIEFLRGDSNTKSNFINHLLSIITTQQINNSSTSEHSNNCTITLDKLVENRDANKGDYSKPLLNINGENIVLNSSNLSSSTEYPNDTVNNLNERTVSSVMESSLTDQLCDELK